MGGAEAAAEQEMEENMQSVGGMLANLRYGMVWYGGEHTKYGGHGGQPQLYYGMVWRRTFTVPWACLPTSVIVWYGMGENLQSAGDMLANLSYSMVMYGGEHAKYGGQAGQPQFRQQVWGITNNFTVLFVCTFML